jgi:hypothetical protein
MVYTRGGGTIAASFSARPGAGSSIVWVPSEHVRFISIHTIIRPSTP